MQSQGIQDSVLDLIGETPMVRLGRIAGSGRARLVAKLEWFNRTRLWILPGASGGVGVG